MSYPAILYPGAVDKPLADSAQLVTFAKTFAFAKLGCIHRGGLQQLSDDTNINKLATELVAGLDESAIRSCITATARILGTPRAEKWWREMQRNAQPKGDEVFRGL